jgi:hypothetical protein
MVGVVLHDTGRVTKKLLQKKYIEVASQALESGTDQNFSNH